MTPADPPRRTFEPPPGAIEQAQRDQQAEQQERLAGIRGRAHRQILTLEAEGETTCRSCHTPLIWALGEGGQAVPLNRAPDPQGTVGVNQYDEWVFGLERQIPGQLDLLAGDTPPARYRLHFEVCPDRDRWHAWGLTRRRNQAHGDR